MTIDKLRSWHREQVERFEDLAKNHKTNGATIHRDAVTRRNTKLAQFHREAVSALENAK